jgi:hypothetical protein
MVTGATMVRVANSEPPRAALEPSHVANMPSFIYTLVVSLKQDTPVEISICPKGVE